MQYVVLNLKYSAICQSLLRRRSESFTRTRTNVPINVPINEGVLELVRQQPGINRTKMAELLGCAALKKGRPIIVSINKNMQDNEEDYGPYE